MCSPSLAGIDLLLGGGTHAALVTGVASKAFEQAVLMLMHGGAVAYIGLPGGKSDEIRASISTITNWELSIRGSNVTIAPPPALD